MKKIKYLSLIVFMALLLTGCGENKEEFKQQEEINDRYIKISEKINSIINDNINPIEEVINKDIGEDKTKIDELSNKKEELSKYLIIINDKKITDLNELKEENKKLEDSLKIIDKNLINLKVEEIENYTLSEDHQINVLSKDITKLTEEVNTLASKQEEKTCKEKLLKGDFSCYAGVYKDLDITGYPESTLEIDKDGAFLLKYNSDTKGEKKYFKKIEKQKNGSYYIYTKANNSVDNYYLFPSSTPVGSGWVPYGMEKTDKTKVRICWYDEIGGSCFAVLQKD